MLSNPVEEYNQNTTCWQPADSSLLLQSDDTSCAHQHRLIATCAKSVYVYKLHSDYNLSLPERLQVGL